MDTAFNWVGPNGPITIRLQTDIVPLPHYRWREPKLRDRAGRTIVNQHDLVSAVLELAGGRRVEEVLPGGYKGKLADIVFEKEDVIVEIKSLTTDRAADPALAEVLGARMVRDRHLGAPMAWGTVQVRLHDLEPRVAGNLLRIVGDRMLDDAGAANKQIKATKAALGRPDALGVLAIVTPPFKLDRESIAWLVRDALREGRNSSIDTLLLIQTPLAAPAGSRTEQPTFITRHVRDQRALPDSLADAIETAWGKVTRQRGERLEHDALDALSRRFNPP